MSYCTTKDGESANVIDALYVNTQYVQIRNVLCSAHQMKVLYSNSMSNGSSWLALPAIASKYPWARPE